MGTYLNPTNILFSRDCKDNNYVDKTLLVEYLNNVCDTKHNLLCVSRPRRFGKTMAMNLITAYYSKGCDSRELFSDLKLSKTPSWDKNLNKFNVIRLNIIDFSSDAKDKKDIPQMISRAVNEELIEEFPNIDIDKEDTLRQSLIKVFKATKEQFVLIMDEYDLLIREQVSEEAFNIYLEFLNGLFKSSAVRETLHFAYLTGILPIVKDKVESKLNEFTEYSMTLPGDFCGFIGFTEDEVKELCSKNSISFLDCKKWYDGYRLGDKTSIYTPNSVITSITQKNFGDYWWTTGSLENIQDYLTYNFDGLKEDIITMLGGGKVEVNIAKFLNTLSSFKSKDDIFTYLIHLGYLTYDNKTKQCWIPNEEMHTEWENAIDDNEDYTPVINIIKESDELLKHTLSMDEEYVANALDNAHTIATNPKNYNNEQALQAAICLAYISSKNTYTIIQEATTGHGYADVLFLPHKSNMTAFLVELKINKSTATALKQIKQKEYGQDLTLYKDNMLFVGINYDKKTKKHKCKIEKL